MSFGDGLGETKVAGNLFMGSHSRSEGEEVMLKFPRDKGFQVSCTLLAKRASGASREHTEPRRKASFSSGVFPVPLVRAKGKWPLNRQPAHLP